jgi:hypothetical protein
VILLRLFIGIDDNDKIALLYRFLYSISCFDYAGNDKDTCNEICELKDSRSRILMRTKVTAKAAINAQIP